MAERYIEYGRGGKLGKGLWQWRAVGGNGKSMDPSPRFRSKREMEADLDEAQALGGRYQGWSVREVKILKPRKAMSPDRAVGGAEGREGGTQGEPAQVGRQGKRGPTGMRGKKVKRLRKKFAASPIAHGLARAPSTRYHGGVLHPYNNAWRAVKKREERRG